MPLSFPMACLCIIRGADPLVRAGPPGPALLSKNRASAIASRPTGGAAADRGVRPTICNTVKLRTRCFCRKLPRSQDLAKQKYVGEQGTQMYRRIQVVDQLRTDRGLSQYELSVSVSAGAGRSSAVSIARTPGIAKASRLYRGVTTACCLGMLSSIDVVTPRC